MNSKSTPSTVLVTGGTGLIGAEVARSLLAAGCKPVLFDFSPSEANVADIRADVVVERGDVTDSAALEEVMRRHRVDRVIHLAAMLLLETDRQPVRAVQVNCVATGQLFELAKSLGIARVVYASSASVYGPKSMYEEMLGRSVVVEDDPVRIFNLYGGTKYLCEQLAAHAAAGGLDVVGLRPVFTYGLGRFTGGAGIINSAIRDAAVTGEGTVTAPWAPHAYINTMYVKDAADQFVKTCLHDGRMSRTVYNMGTGEYSSFREMMDAAEQYMPNKGKIKFALTPETADPSYDYPDLDSSVLRKELGWEGRYNFGTAARECIEVYVRS